MRDSPSDPVRRLNVQARASPGDQFRRDAELFGVFDSVAKPGLSDYEYITQLPFYRGQTTAISRWIAGRTLDVGSSYGRFSALSTTVTSLDINRESLRRGLELGNIRSAVQGSGLTLPFRDAAFDTILSIGVVEHIPPPSMPQFLDELTRVAKHGGRLVIVATSPYALFSLVRVRLWDDWLHPYSPFRLRASIRRRGWRPVGWMSTGLLGVTQILARTANGPVPWARTIAQVFARA